MTIGTLPAGGSKSAVRRSAGRKFTFDKVSFMVVFLGLPVVGFLVFVVSPFIQAFYYSLTNWSGFSPNMDFIGLKNYGTLFSDGKFLKALGNSIELGIIIPLVTIVFALVLATLVTVGGSSRGNVRGIRNSSFYRVVTFFPYVIPGIVVGLLWVMVLQPSSGLLNGALTGLGFGQFKDFPWLGAESTAMPITMFVIVWGFVGFYMVLFVAAIKGVPAELFEAARIDGAGRLRTAVSLTIPMIRDSIQTSYIYMGIFSLDAFVYMAALNSNGGPANSTLVVSQYLFEQAFVKSNFGIACAMGVVLALITLLFAALVFGVNRLTGGTNEVAE